MDHNLFTPEPLFDGLQHWDAHEVLSWSQPLPHPRVAEQDYALTRRFLFLYRGSDATFASYRRECERLLQWCWLVAHTTLPSLLVEDIEAYLTFCLQPPASWVSDRHHPRFLDRNGQRVRNPSWRPFRAPRDPNLVDQHFSDAALRAILSILSTFFNYLVGADHLSKNPVSNMRQKSKFLKQHQGPRPVRRLSERQWQVVMACAHAMADETPEVHERTLFVMSALYHLYLRVSELSATPRWTPSMHHFQRDQEGHWWFWTVGKGNKERQIAVSPAMLEALKRYRVFLGLPPYPSLRERHYLLPRLRGHGPIASTRQVRTIVQTCFDRAIDVLNAEGEEDEAEALGAATVHWLRHTGISDDVKHRPREHVRDDAGHASSSTTDRYIDIERRARASSKHALPKQSPRSPTD